MMTTLRKINCLALLCVLSSAPTWAQDDDYGYTGSSDDALTVDQMDIDGIYRKRRSRAEKLENNRRKLERRNENLVRQKIEDARLKEEQKMTNKLRKMFKANSLRSDGGQEDYRPTRVQTVKKEIYVAPVKKKDPAKFKIIPHVGAMVVSSDNINFDSSSKFGIQFESNITPQFALGMGIGYERVDIADINLGFFGFFPGFNQGGFNAREMEYRRTTVDLHGKFFMIPDSNFSPYVGAAIGFSRDRLKYDNSQNYLNNFSFNQPIVENYRRNYASWAVIAGSELKFTRHFGLNLELRHSRGFGGNNDNNNQIFIPTPDQLNLNRLGNELSDASFTSLSLGFIGSF